METNLREALAEIEVEGILAQKNLELKMENNKGVIRGDMVIQIDEDRSVTFNVYVNQYKSDGKGGFTDEKNSIFEGMNTILEEYKSIANDGIENADRIRVTKGSIRPSTFFDDKGMKHEKVKYQTNFFNRINNEAEFEPKAKFDIELYISSIINEIGKDENGEMTETRRVLVKGWLPTYNGIEPIQLVAPKEYGIAETILNDFEIGQTVNFYGDCMNTKKEWYEDIPVKVGKPRKKRHIEYKNELIIESASDPYEEEGVKPAYKTEVINAAIADRELLLKEKAEKAVQKKTSTNNSFNKPKASGRTLPNF